MIPAVVIAFVLGASGLAQPMPAPTGPDQALQWLAEGRYQEVHELSIRLLREANESGDCVEKAKGRPGRESLCSACCLPAFFVFRPTGVAGAFVSGYFGMSWIFALLGFARTYVTKSTALLRYANDAVYPFYFFHQTRAVALVYWLAPAAAGVPAKWAMAAGGTFLGSLACYEISRRIGPVGPLVGLKAS